jgi:Transcriptional regulator PadR-like family
MPSWVAYLPMSADAQALKGHLDTLLLASLEGGPRHGYAVKEALRSGSDARFDLPAGTIYPALVPRPRSRPLPVAGCHVVGQQNRAAYQLLQTEAGGASDRLCQSEGLADLGLVCTSTL